MISQKIISLLRKNNKFLDFITNNGNYEVLLKRINEEQLKRLLLEYPSFLNLKKNDYTQSLKGIKKDNTLQFISCLTLVTNEIEANNYSKLKKIRFYVDELTGKIIKTLQNRLIH